MILPGNQEQNWLNRFIRPQENRYWQTLAAIPIRYKLIGFFLVISLLPLGIVGTMSYTSSKEAMVQKITEYSLKVTTQSVANLQQKLRELENVAGQLLLNQAFIEALVRLESSPDDGGLEALKKTAAAFFNTYMISYQDIGAMVFIGEGGPERIVTVTKDYAAEMPGFIRRFRRTRSYQDILRAGGSSVWVSSLKLGASHYELLGRSLKHPETGKSMGILTIFIDEEKFDRLVNFYLYNQADLAMDQVKNYALIIDEQGKVVSTPFKEDIGKPVGRMITGIAPLRELLRGKTSDRDYGGEQNQGSYLTRVNGQSSLVVYKSIGSETGIGANSRWHLLSITLTSYLYREAWAVGLNTLMLGLTVAFLTIFLSVRFSLNISKALQQMVQAMETAENGVLSIRIPVKAQDEFGYLATCFNRMLIRISGLLMDTKNATQAVLERAALLETSSEQAAHSARSVARAMEEISRGTSEQTRQAEQTTAQMDQLAVEIGSLVRNSNEVAQITGSTRDLSVQSKAIIQQLIRKSGETEQITNRIVADLADLNTNTGQIQAITALIANISEQTNLLALNAAIEAARAGHVGHGFAVVADEVNQLAVQSKEAARGIDKILKQIQIKNQNSAQTVQQASLILSEQQSAVASTQRAFDGIINEMDQAVRKISKMDQRIQGIDQFKEHAAQAFVNISLITEETAAATEEVTATTEEQTAIAERIKEMADDLKCMAARLVEAASKFHV